MNDAAMRNRFVDDAITTASPARLLCLLYDRLLLDVRLGRQCLDDGDRTEARRYLAHAQEIVLELRASLDVEVWEGGPGLAALYAWLLGEFGRGMSAPDGAELDGAQRVVAELREAWTQAAGAASAAPAATSLAATA